MIIMCELGGHLSSYTCSLMLSNSVGLSRCAEDLGDYTLPVLQWFYQQLSSSRNYASRNEWFHPEVEKNRNEIMTALSHGNVCRITGPMWEESTKATMRWCFIVVSLNKLLKNKSTCMRFEASWRTGHRDIIYNPKHNTTEMIDKSHVSM